MKEKEVEGDLSLVSASSIVTCDHAIIVKSIAIEICNCGHDLIAAILTYSAKCAVIAGIKQAAKEVLFLSLSLLHFSLFNFKP